MTSPSIRAEPMGAMNEKPVMDWMLAAALVAVVAVLIRAIAFTPTEATQGLAQKIYYIHVPSALGAYVAVGLLALASLAYLWLRDVRADRLAEASAEVGIVFLSVVLATGPLWGRRIWGTWWAWWDMRLTLTLFLWFVVAAYLVLRGAIDDPGMRGRYGAVLAILGALLIPFIHLSVYLFPTLHPMPIVLKPERPSLSPEMLTTFLLSFAAFTLLVLALIRSRYRLASLGDAVRATEGAR